MKKMIKILLLLQICSQLIANNNREITDGCDLPDSDIISYLK